MSDPRTLAVADQLLLLEYELRRQQMWSEQPPTPAAMASQSPFCVDSMRLEAWLQWIFVPRMSALIEGGAALPERCGISPIAEVEYASHGGRLDGLLAILRELDRLLERR